MKLHSVTILPGPYRLRPVEIVILLLLAFGPVAPAEAQTTEEIFRLEWNVGSEVTIYGNPIRRLAGENRNAVTNIAFIDHHQIYSDGSTELYEKRASLGGKIEVFLARKRERPVVSNNDKMPSIIVIVKDAKENQLLRHKLERPRPFSNENGQSYFHESVSLPVIIQEPFFVYVIDSLTKEITTTKFEVTRKLPKTGNEVFAYDYLEFTTIYSLFDTITVRELKKKKLDQATLKKLQDRKALLGPQLRATHSINGEQFANKETNLIGVVKGTFQFYGMTFIEIDVKAEIEPVEGDIWFGDEGDMVLYKIAPKRKFVQDSDVCLSCR